jgi:hypothetical protein
VIGRKEMQDGKIEWFENTISTYTKHT